MRDREHKARAPLRRIRRRAMRNAADRITDFFDEYNVRGDTPIEQVLYTALVAEIECGCHEATEILSPPRGEYLKPDILEMCGPLSLPLIVESQVKVLTHCVDFLVSIVTHEQKRVFLVVECDGHDYHERTKEQAARDRARDRRFQAAGYTIYRFTGSEIWRDPCACADQIIDWAVLEATV